MKKIYILFLGICMGAAPLWAMPVKKEVERLDFDDNKELSDTLKRIRAATILGAISTCNQKLANELYSIGIDAALLISDDMRLIFWFSRDIVKVSDKRITLFLDLNPSIKEFIESFIQSHQDVLGNNKLWERLRVKKDLMLLSDPSLNDVTVMVKKDDCILRMDVSSDSLLPQSDQNFSVKTLKVDLNNLYLKDPQDGYQNAILYRRYNLGVPYLLDAAKIDDATRARVNQELRSYLRVLGPLLIHDFEGTMNRLGEILQTPVGELAEKFPIEDQELEMFKLPVPVVRDVVREEISPTTVGEKAGFNVHLATPRAKIMGLMGIVGAVMLIARKKVKQYTPSLKGITLVPKRYPYISALVVAGFVATAGVGAGKYKRSREQE